MSVSSSGDEEQESSSSSPSPLLTNDEDNDDDNDDDNGPDADASDQHEDTLISDEYGIHPEGSIFDIPPMFGNKNAGDPNPTTAEDQDETSEQESPLCSAESNKQVPHRSRQQSILLVDSAAHCGPLETTTGSTGNTHTANMNNSSNEAMDNQTSSMVQRTHATGSAGETQLRGLFQLQQQQQQQQQHAVANPTPPDFNWLSHLAAVAAAAPADTRSFLSLLPLGRGGGPSSSQHFQPQTLPQYHQLLLPQQLQPQQQQQQQQVLPFFLQHPSTNPPLLVPNAMIPQLQHPAAKLSSHQFPLAFIGGGGNMINYNNNNYHIAATKPSPVATGNHPFIMPSFTMPGTNTPSLSSSLSTTRGIVSPPGVIGTTVAGSCIQHFLPNSSSAIPTPLTLLPGRKGASTRLKHANVAVGSIEPFPVSRH
jgi:hypothetical protein